MVGSDALRTAAQTSLGIWVLAGHPPLWGFLLLQALVGIGAGVFMPSTTALIPALTNGRDLQQANALRHLAKSIGRVGGPALAGFVVAAASPGWAIVADGLSYGVSLVFLLSLRLCPSTPAPRQSFGRELREGWREFWSRRWLRAVVGQAGLLGISAWPAFYVLGAVIAKDTLGGATAWGLILSALGVGTVVGGIAALRLHPTRPLLVVVAFPAMWVLPLLGLAFHLSPVWIALAALVVGASGAIGVALWDTTMQREIPARLLSRVSAYDLSVSFLLLPLGYALVGPVSSVVGMAVSLVGASGIALASVALVLLVAPVVRIRAAAASG
jgi:predicted MFS family arabinose efflux permease